MCSTPSHNKAVVACAGSGKTSYIVEKALALSDDASKILITTYTNENLDQIESLLSARTTAGVIPRNISILSWYTFLLREGVRPYQNFLLPPRPVRSVFFSPKRNIFHPKHTYLTSESDIYHDKTAEFVFECDKISNGLVIRRLEQIYTHIFIDEMQDLAGYDLNLLELLLRSKIIIVMVGDPRQATFSTNQSSKNRQYRGGEFFLWLKKIEQAGLTQVEERNACARCVQAICDFADSLYPTLSSTKSTNATATGHDGLFTINRSDINRYYAKYRPVVLRWDKDVDTHGLPALNFGASKGRTFDRVLIFPTKPMLNYLKTKDLNKAGQLSKFYVAVTRARQSVTFVVDESVKGMEYGR